MLRLGIISNPFAKTNKDNPEHNTQMWYTLANEGVYKVTHSLIELEKVCQEFFERKINLVGIVGGDGSIGLVLSNLLKAYGNNNLPKILLLKGGTINFLASNLSIYSSALTCLNDTLYFIKKNISLYEVPVRTIDVNGRVGFIFAGGVASAFLQEFYKNKTNKAGAVLCAVKYFLDGVLGGRLNGKFKDIVKPQLLKITTLPEPLWSKKSLPNIEKLYTILFASCVPKLPLNINLFKKINLKSQSAELLASTDSGTPLLKRVVEAVFGRDLTKRENVASVVFNEVCIESNLPINYSLDGDLCKAEDGKVNIKYGPTFIFCSPYLIGKKISRSKKYLKEVKNGFKKRALQRRHKSARREKKFLH